MKAVYVGDCSEGVEGPDGEVVLPRHQAEWPDDAVLNPDVWRVVEAKPSKTKPDAPEPTEPEPVVAEQKDGEP